MRIAMRVAGIAASVLLVPAPGHALDRSECKQYGGNTNCWMPVIGDWKYSVCGEVGTFLSYDIAVCTARRTGRHLVLSRRPRNRRSLYPLLCTRQLSGARNR